MKRSTALTMGIDALQKEYKKVLFLSDSKASVDKRIEITKAIEVLDALRRQKEMNI